MIDKEDYKPKKKNKYEDFKIDHSIEKVVKEEEEDDGEEDRAEE